MISKYSMHPQLEREARTVALMIKLYCRKKHGSGNELCPECRELHDYALERLAKCPYSDCKPACKDCTTHCYRKKYKEKIRQVMAFSGPRMILHHPILAVRHLIDSRKRKSAGTK